ncbi:MAG: hypothetical protein P4L55_07210 [Syntrophobacteraceae bacterium]|nr:hypothetical protein [Syntrophobacteraceae bacterium]
MNELQADLSLGAARPAAKITGISLSGRKARAATPDYLLAAVLVSVSACAFLYGDANARFIALIISLAAGLYRPPLLIFSLSLATSLDIVSGHVFTPMRVALIFAAIALLARYKRVSGRIETEHLIALMYLWAFGMWCLLCIYVRAELGGLEEVIMMLAYAAVCLFLLAIVEEECSVSNLVWLGLFPTVISTISASFHLRPVHWHDYLVTGEGLRYRGILNDPNYLSSILVVGFAICLASAGAQKGVLKKAIYLGLSAAFFLALWAPQSRGGLYTASLCLALFVLWQAGLALRSGQWGNLLLVALIGAMVALFIATHTHTRAFSVVRERGFTLVRTINKLAVEPILRHPLFGPGEAKFVNRYCAPHDTLLSIGLEYGIPGMFLMLVGVFYCSYNLWKRRGGGSMVVFLPFMAINVILFSFSAPGHKLLWFYLVAGMVFRQTAQTMGDN